MLRLEGRLQSFEDMRDEGLEDHECTLLVV